MKKLLHEETTFCYIKFPREEDLLHNGFLQIFAPPAQNSSLTFFSPAKKICYIKFIREEDLLHGVSWILIRPDSKQ